MLKCQRQQTPFVVRRMQENILLARGFAPRSMVGAYSM